MKKIIFQEKFSDFDGNRLIRSSCVLGSRKKFGSNCSNELAILICLQLLVAVVSGVMFAKWRMVSTNLKWVKVTV